MNLPSGFTMVPSVFNAHLGVLCPFPYPSTASYQFIAHEFEVLDPKVLVDDDSIHNSSTQNQIPGVGFLVNKPGTSTIGVKYMARLKKNVDQDKMGEDLTKELDGEEWCRFAYPQFVLDEFRHSITLLLSQYEINPDSTQPLETLPRISNHYQVQSAAGFDPVLKKLAIELARYWAKTNLTTDGKMDIVNNYPNGAMNYLGELDLMRGAVIFGSSTTLSESTLDPTQTPNMSNVMDDNQTSGFPNNVPSTTTTTTATTTTATNTTSPSSHLYSFSVDKAVEYSSLHFKKVADKILANSKVSGLTFQQVWAKAQNIKGFVRVIALYWNKDGETRLHVDFDHLKLYLENKLGINYKGEPVGETGSQSGSRNKINQAEWPKDIFFLYITVDFFARRLYLGRKQQSWSTYMATINKTPFAPEEVENALAFAQLQNPLVTRRESVYWRPEGEKNRQYLGSNQYLVNIISIFPNYIHSLKRIDIGYVNNSDDLGRIEKYLLQIFDVKNNAAFSNNSHS